MSGKLLIYDPIYTHLFSGQRSPVVSLQPIFPLYCSDVSTAGNHFPPFTLLSFCIAEAGKLLASHKTDQGCCDHLHSPALHPLGYEFISSLQVA